MESGVRSHSREAFRHEQRHEDCESDRDDSLRMKKVDRLVRDSPSAIRNNLYCAYSAQHAVEQA